MSRLAPSPRRVTFFTCSSATQCKRCTFSPRMGAIRAGRVVAHWRCMAQLYIWSIGVVGLFTLLPGRRMHAMVMDGRGWPWFWLAAMAFAIGGAVLWRAQPSENAASGAHFSLFKTKPNR